MTNFRLTHRTALLLSGIAIGAAIGVPIGPAIITAQATTPACAFEDGNPDGTACDWTDPDTGTVFHVQAHTYGDPRCLDICLGA